MAKLCASEFAVRKIGPRVHILAFRGSFQGGVSRIWRRITRSACGILPPACEGHSVSSLLPSSINLIRAVAGFDFAIPGRDGAGEASQLCRSHEKPRSVIMRLG